MSRNIKTDQNISKETENIKYNKKSRTNNADDLFGEATNGLARGAHHKYPNVSKTINSYQQS
jgi:hypothetical protein